eukprot:TRINITY_DN24399_c0_g1_i1.p1 TRINITY_DN24399_c0_g1~~TRINITY_DN24399_c0_g1_i1.p1  ORF type:complete len:169 (+),score=18.60 TRINITY_DN24399_c0_g1_i1:103-609(+)
MTKGASDFARAVLERRVPYFTCLIGIKVLGLWVGLAPPTEDTRVLLLFACAAATMADILFRVGASSRCALSISKHGTDILLVAVVMSVGASCKDIGAGEVSRTCHAVRLLLPFVILVSVGGNLMRLTRDQRREETMRGEGWRCEDSGLQGESSDDNVRAREVTSVVGV